jgi:hypothetical protein
MSNTQFPNALWSEILPGLWQGGTDYDDVIGHAAIGLRPTKSEFDSVYTLYGSANPADWGMKEVRFAFYDSDMRDFDPQSDLWLPVAEAHADWRAGKRVLIRCQAGLNRSGLVMALVLIREGYSPSDAIDLIRTQRGYEALCNHHFEQWLLESADLGYWRSRMAA